MIFKNFLQYPEAVVHSCLKLSQYSQENTCVGESLFNKVADLKACNFIEKEIPEQVFFREYCEFFKNSFFYGKPPVAACENLQS